MISALSSAIGFLSRRMPGGRHRAEPFAGGGSRSRSDWGTGCGRSAGSDRDSQLTVADRSAAGRTLCESPGSGNRSLCPQGQSRAGCETGGSRSDHGRLEERGSGGNRNVVIFESRFSGCEMPHTDEWVEYITDRVNSDHQPDEHRLGVTPLEDRRSNCLRHDLSSRPAGSSERCNTSYSAMNGRAPAGFRPASVHG